MEVLLCLGACEAAPPAARALLSTLAKLLAMAHAPGSALCAELRVRRIGVRRPRRPTAARRVHANKRVRVSSWCLTWRSRDASRTPCLCERTVPESLKPGKKFNVLEGCRRRWASRASAGLQTCCVRMRASARSAMRCRPSCCRTLPPSCCLSCSCRPSACARWSFRATCRSAAPPACQTSFQTCW